MCIGLNTKEGTGITIVSDKNNNTNESPVNESLANDTQGGSDFIYTTQMKQHDEMIERENAVQEKKDRLLMRFMTAFGNIFALNICFIIASLGIVTIGAALTALFSMCIRLQDSSSDAMIFKEYFTEFKKNFKKATIEWLIVLVAIVVMYTEYLLILNFPGPIASVYTVVLIAELIVSALVMAFLFPLTARFENTVFNTFKNAFLLSISNLWDFAKIFLIWFVPLYVTISNPVVFFLIWYLYLLIAFGTMAYLSTITIRNVFNKIQTRQDEEKKKREEEHYNLTHSSGVAEKANIISKYTGNKNKPVDNKNYNSKNKSNGSKTK